MKKLIKYLLIALLLLLLVTTVLVWVFVLQDEPLVFYKTELSDTDLARARLILQEHDPRRYKVGVTKNISLNEKDLNLVANYTLKKLPVFTQAKIKILQNASYFALSSQMPRPFSSRYLNASVQADLNENQEFVFSSLMIGDLEFNGATANWLSEIVYKAAIIQFPELDLARESVKSVHMVKGNVTVEYAMSKETLAQIKQRGTKYIIPADMKARLVAYQNALAVITRDNTLPNPSLIYLLKPMLELTRQRSESSQEYSEESRAVLIALAAYIVRRNINPYIDNDAMRGPRFINYTLNKRNDLAKHFLVSAALVAIADDVLANQVGIQKEILDSQGGSGFSFADLAADRTGARMANLLLNESSAAKFLDNMINAREEREFMPNTSSLPEGFQQTDFNRLYKDINSNEYQAVVDRIDEMINTSPVFTGI